MEYEILTIPPNPSVPKWLHAAHAEYMDNTYANRPVLKLLVDREVMAPENLEWEYDESRGYYFTNYLDGLHQGYYSGKPIMTKLEKREGNQFIAKHVLATPQEEGFGGRHFHLNMKDGTEIVLRGPWAGIPPEGYNTITLVDVDRVGPHDWFGAGGYFGVCVTDDLFLHIVGKLLPTMGVARVKHSYGWKLEPFTGVAPKGVVVNEDQDLS